MFKKIFHIPESIKPHTPEYGSYIFIYAASLAFFFTMVYFSLYNSFITYQKELATFECISGVLILLLFFYLRRSRNIQRSSFILVFMVGSLTIYFDLVSIKENYSLIWNFFLPLSAFYLLGNRRGTVVVTVFYLFFFSYLVSITPEILSYFALTNLLIGFSIYAAMLYGYEMSRSHSFQALEKLSQTDTLTAIHNRMKTNTLLHQTLERAKRYDEHFALAMIDIDHFKKVNDTYGHQVGDDILIEFTQLIQTHIRSSDIFGRWGGEEFLLLLPNTDCSTATAIIEKLLKKVEQYPFSISFSNTASFGLVSYNGQASVLELINQADKALYEAKKYGRNCVFASIDYLPISSSA